MTSRCGISAAGRLWIASLVLVPAALLALAGAASHTHVTGGLDDCAVCKATRTVATLEPAAEARHAAGNPSRGLPTDNVTIPRPGRPHDCRPRAPPAL